MFYDRVKQLCKDNRVSITTMARELHLSPSAPGSWKTGSLPKPETVIKIAEYFGVTTDFLLLGDKKFTTNTIGDITSSAVAQGNSGGNVSISTSSNQSSDLQGLEAEMLRIFRALDFRGKTSLMQSAYALEEEQAKKNS